jgi:phosphatidate cytidylyltransferase
MLINFYLFSLSFILFVLVTALIGKQKDTRVRALTMLVILHIVCFAIWQGSLTFAILVGCMLSLSLYELSKNYQTNRIFLAGISILIFTTLLSNMQLNELAIPGFIVISIITLIGSKEVIQNNSYLFAFTSCFLIPCSISLIKLMQENSKSIILILLLLQLNDSFGYLFGKVFGKIYLFPTISPNKSLEGYFFGVIGIITGMILLHTYIPILTANSFNQKIIIFFYILIFGNLGDLLMSSLKRKLEIKDFSKLLPGHGGVLDRFDNVFFVAPIFYILFRHKLI